jgi:uncharacterized protein
VIDIFDLARTQGFVEGRMPFGEMGRARTALRDVSGSIGFRFDGRIDARGRPAGVLHLHGELPLTCDRCGRPVSLPLERTVEFYFVTEEADVAAHPVSVDEEPEPLLGSTQFDLQALVEDEAILSIPLSPRHVECPVPDTDADAVTRDGAPNPFAALQGLLHKNGR